MPLTNHQSLSKSPQARGSLTSQQDYAFASSWKTKCMGLNGQPGMELTKEPLKCDGREVANVGNNWDNCPCNCLHPNLKGPTRCCLHSYMQLPD